MHYFSKPAWDRLHRIWPCMRNIWPRRTPAPRSSLAINWTSFGGLLQQRQEFPIIFSKLSGAAISLCQGTVPAGLLRHDSDLLKPSTARQTFAVTLHNLTIRHAELRSVSVSCNSAKNSPLIFRSCLRDFPAALGFFRCAFQLTALNSCTSRPALASNGQWPWLQALANLSGPPSIKG